MARLLANPGRPSLLVVFFTVLIDLIGFGIVLPLLPRYGERFGAQGIAIGLILGTFSLMQFLCSAWWGRLSDRIGRRPVLLVSNAGSVMAYALFAVSALPSLPARMALLVLFVSRVLAGACGANVAVASAYIADVTPPEKRSRGMALIGVAFGLGFVIGPAIGALSADWLGLMGPGVVATALCAANFLLALLVLGESRQPASAPVRIHTRSRQWVQIMRHPSLALPVVLFFMATFSFTALEATLPLLVGSPLFRPDEVRDPECLGARLASPKDPVSMRLAACLSDEALDAIRTRPPQTRGRLRTILCREFNRLIQSPALFDGVDLAQVRMRPETRDLVVCGSSGDSRTRANRMLVEDAFPSELTRQSLYFDDRRIGYLFALSGVISVIVQGGLIARMLKQHGERRVIAVALLIVAVGLAVVPYAPEFSPAGGDALTADAGGAGWARIEMLVLLMSLALFSFGAAMNRAPIMGLISMASPPSEQGTVMGVAQSAGTLARILGPPIATALFYVHPHIPYLGAAAIALAGSVLAWRFLR